jgi:hypothetical protein
LTRKKAIVLVFAILTLVSAVLIYRETRVIGEITGAEFNRLTIGDTEYTLTSRPSFAGAANQDHYLGKANYYDQRNFRFYSVKGDQEGTYIKALWDWESFWYVRKD